MLPAGVLMWIAAGARKARARAYCLVAAVCLATAATPRAEASPNVPRDHEAYGEFAWLLAMGRLPIYLGGMQPLTELRVQALLLSAGAPADATLLRPGVRGFWGRPLQRVIGRLHLIREDARPYSTVVRPRDVAGEVSLSCEHTEGRPCGEGIGLVSELDSSAGYGRWVSVFTRLRAHVGTDAYESDVDLDRGYVNAELGPAAIEVGRDVLVLGPSSRTQLAWGDNAPPIDHVRISTSRPLDLVGEHGSVLRGNILYFLGRLRKPQRYPNDLVSVTRAQVDLWNQVEVGAGQLLQVLGEGAPSLGLWDFIAEHVRRKDLSATETDTSNRRLFADVSVLVPSLCGARFYYLIAFEDWRDQFDEALRFDADHLIGLDLAAIGPGRRHGLVVELQKTGMRSHEHNVRTTGFTNLGRIVGSPLGPDAVSLYGEGRIELTRWTVQPWAEVARLSSDTYGMQPGVGIWRVARGVAEWRYRVGARVRLPLRPGLRLEVRSNFEYVRSFAFEPGAARVNVGGTAVLVWHPALGILGGSAGR